MVGVDDYILSPNPKPKLIILDIDIVTLIYIHLMSSYKTIYIHHFPCLRYSEYYDCSMRITTDLLTAKGIKYADEIIVQTKCLQDIFVRSFPKVSKNSVSLTPCFDTGLWLEDAINVRQIVPDLPNDYILFVAFGEYRKRSNFKLLLQALDHMFVSIRNPLKEKLHLVIVGRYNEKSASQTLHYNKLIEMAREMPYASQITFLKQLPIVHKKTLIQACTAVVHSVCHDLYPGPILVAMSLAKPVIAIDCGFASTVITHRISGILIEPDAYKLALVMYKVATSVTLQSFLGNMALSTFSNNYSFEKFAETLNDLVSKHIEPDRQTM